MQSTEDLIGKGLDVLNKALDDEVAQPITPADPNQPVEKTVEPDHLDTLPWYHPDHLMHHMPTEAWICIGVIVTAVFGYMGHRYKNRQK